MVDTVLSDDAKVILLLCSTVALDASSGLRPLGPKAWSGIEERFGGTVVESPAGLAGMPAEAMVRDLGIPLREAERMNALIDRAGRFAIEFDRLRSRGIWAVTKADDDYPARLRERLAGATPPVLFGAGSRDMLNMRGVGVVGSRAANEATLTYAALVGSGCARAGVAIVSGAAKGVDESAMLGSLDAGGLALGVLADSLERQVQRKQWRDYAIAEQLVLVTPYHPAKPFDRGGAMGRNKLVYCLSEACVVVTTAEGKGGTWTGAVEALKAQWVPVFVRETAGVGSPGNQRLLADGEARSLPADAGQAVAVLTACLGVDTAPPTAGAIDETAAAPSSAPDARQDGPLPDTNELSLSGPAVATSAAAASPQPPSLLRDVYAELLPVLLLGVRERLGVKRIAGLLGMVLGQAQAWLARAADEGLVQKTSSGFLLTEGGQEALAGSSLSQYDDVAPTDHVAHVHEGVLSSVPEVLVGVMTRKEACERIAGSFGFTVPQAEALLDERMTAESGVQEGLFGVQ